MLRLSVLAAAALAGAHACDSDGDCNADEICRVAVAASGRACDTAAAKTCVKRSLRKESCGGGGGAAQDCFRNQCLTTLACRPNQLSPATLPGTCVKQCDLGGGEMVYEGWRGAMVEAGKWCHTRFCDGRDAKKTAGVLTPIGDTTAACPTDPASGLKCCAAAGDPTTQACCGATGQWVTKDKTTDKVECAGVKEAVGGPLTSAAPFGKSCTASCPAIPLPAPGIPAHDDGWTGYSPLADKWCNKCLCSKGTTQCQTHKCPTLACCPPAAKKADQVCCGVTGEWVTKDKDDKVACGGVTLPYADGLATQPFHAACAADRDCVVGTTKPPVTIPHGKTVRHPIAERGCNTCTCTDGKLVCETALCPPAQCCRGEKPAGTQVCCGLDGLWKPVDTTAKCGASVPTQVEGGGAATGYPFGAACVGCEANVYDKAATAWKKRIVSVGWTGPKETGVACDTCSCKVDGDPTVCTDLKACPAVRCCGAAAPAPAADYVCCGATGRWVRKGAGDAVVCDGVAFVKGDPNTDALLGAACAADVCTLTGAEKVADGWVGRNTGADWCQLCRCDDKATPKLACTKNKCALRCCAGPKPTTPGTWKCCGATGVWVRENAAGDYSCGGVTLKTGVPLSDTECTAPATTKCTLHDAGATEVEQGWSGPGLGATNWCRACKCGAAQAGGAVACPAVPTCPAVEKLRCCGKEKTDAAHVCCGLTGEWVAADAQCGVVDLGVAGTAAAPVSAACPECTLYGTTKVAVGWRGFVPGTNWCNKCLCTRDGNLKCSTRTCPALTCCAAAKVGTVACCGTTGEWVAESSPGKYTCAHVTVEDADKLRGPFADACAGTCTLADGTTKVAVGWAGKKGDGCNYCKCVTAGD
eukprot:Rhum_TRINITY_DN15013_c0_g1::Rhum_TRINITY_DN15013_c0_g1_i1::g.134915::m.134915